MNLRLTMRNFLALVISALTITLLTSCVTVYEPLPLTSERSYSAITSHSDVFKPRAGQSFAWFTDRVLSSGGEAEAAIPIHVRELIAESLEAGLIAKGFRVADNASEADFMIGAGILVNDSDHDKTMLKFMEVFPAIRETLAADQPASLLVAAGRQGDLKQHHLLWRGAVNAAVATDEMPHPERQRQIHQIVEALLAQFP